MDLNAIEKVIEDGIEKVFRNIGVSYTREKVDEAEELFIIKSSNGNKRCEIQVLSDNFVIINLSLQKSNATFSDQCEATGYCSNDILSDFINVFLLPIMERGSLHSIEFRLKNMENGVCKFDKNADDTISEIACKYEAFAMAVNADMIILF